MSTNYKVGYKKPPTHTQFKKGKSGNPTGRPKGSSNATTMLDKILSQKIHVREGEKTKTITKLEAMIQSLMIKAIKGDTKAAALVASLLRQAGKLNPPADEGTGFRGGVLRVVVPNLTPEELEKEMAKQQDELQKHHRYVNFPKKRVESD